MLPHTVIEIRIGKKRQQKNIVNNNNNKEYLNKGCEQRQSRFHFSFALILYECNTFKHETKDKKKERFVSCIGIAKQFCAKCQSESDESAYEMEISSHSYQIDLLKRFVAWEFNAFTFCSEANRILSHMLNPRESTTFA